MSGLRSASQATAEFEALLDRIDVPGGDAHGLTPHCRTREAWLYSAKLVPQPQEAVACGLLTLKADPIRSSTKSISAPAM